MYRIDLNQLKLWAPRLLAAVLPLVLFGTFFHWGVLNPTHIGWILFDHGLGANDWGQHFLGWHAFRHSPWREANHQTLLAWPTGLSIIYTDSNPPLAFLFKAIGPLLPDPFQYIGPWFLLCLGLHAFVAWKLVRPFAQNDWQALAGVCAMSALPALYNRMRHDTLMAHWLILWAFWIFLHAPRDRRRHAWWAANLTLGALIHPYLLFMQMAVWGGDVLKQLWVPLKARDLRTAMGVIGAQGLIFVPMVTGLWAVGVFSGQSPGAVGYGDFALGLDAPFNPVLPEFSTFIKPHPQLPWQMFEGFQYLGAGLIALMILALALRFGLKATPAAVVGAGDTVEVRRALAFAESRFLVLPMLVTLCLGLTHKVHLFENTLISLPLRQAMIAPLSILRASGRLFWPISYGLILMAVVSLYRAMPRTQIVLFCGCLMLQMIDLQGFIRFLHSQSVHAEEPRTFFLTTSPKWEGLIRSAKLIDVEPPDPQINEPLFYEIAYRAIGAGVPVTSMYAARPNLAQERIERDQRLDFIEGRVPEDHLAVFLTRCDAPAPLRPRLKSLDGVPILPPRDYRGQLDPAAAILPDPYAGLAFGRKDDGACLLGRHWSVPDEDGGTWSEGPEASLDVPLKIPEGNYTTRQARGFKLKLSAFFENSRVNIYVHGHLVSSVMVNIKPKWVHIRLNPAWLDADSVRIDLEVKQPWMARWAQIMHRQFCFGAKLYNLQVTP